MSDKQKYKRFIYGEKKGKHGTEWNELKCQLLNWRPSSDW